MMPRGGRAVRWAAFGLCACLALAETAGAESSTSPAKSVAFASTSLVNVGAIVPPPAVLAVTLAKGKRKHLLHVSAFGQSFSIGANLVPQVNGLRIMEPLHDLRGRGGKPDEDWFRLRQEPYSSYEVVVDGSAGDVTPVVLERVAADGTTVLQSSAAVGLGAVRSLRFENATANAVDDQLVVVRSGGACSNKCKAGDVYRVRFYETTYASARFNNSGTQVTVLLLQNPASYTVTGSVRLWDATGALVGTSPFALDAKELFVLATQSVAPGVSGSLTVSHDGRYGDLAGKTTSLEPATGFSFDTPLVHRPR